MNATITAEPPGPRGEAVLGASSTSDNPRTTLSHRPPPSTRHKRTAIFLQEDCLKHRFIRSRDTSGIFERPERLHALKLGLAAAIARIEGADGAFDVEGNVRKDEGEDDLAAALARMAIESTSSASSTPVSASSLRTISLSIRHTCAHVSLLDDAAVKYVHGDVGGDVYLERLVMWARDSQKNIAERGTEMPEMPEGAPPLDLYLCPGSIDAIQGSIGAICEAVDASVAATRIQTRTRPDDPCERAFVVIRPPGHHCGEDTPSGFCFINNVAIGAAHAHLNHGIQRIIILDIDLHHGNGTQSIVWQINEETYRQTLESDAPPSKPGPRIFYGSLHDILSFPCEDGKPEMVQAASTSIHGPHGQYIENIHLQRYDSETHFWEVLYPGYLGLLRRARDFLDETGGPGDDVIVFISCGFDAGEHEYPSMSRHHRKVPVGFYHRFTRETCELADTYARGRVVSVLEGGYSDRALTSGAMAHLCGLVDVPGRASRSDSDEGEWVDERWWSLDELVKLEKATKPRKSASARASMDDWIARTLYLLTVLDGGADASGKASERGAGSGADAKTSGPMTLRERRKPMLEGALPDSARPGKTRRSASTMKPSVERTSVSSKRIPSAGVLKSESGREETEAREVPSGGAEKKLPRVILRVRPPDTS